MTRAREALRATTSSLVAPAVLLAAALVVAVGGSGADALSSLRQLTSGPDVPPTSVEMVSRDAPVGADVGQLEGQLMAAAGTRSAQGSPASELGGSAAAGAPSTTAGGPGGASGPSPVSAPAGGSPAPDGAAQGATGAPAASAPPSSSSPSGAGADPAAKVLEQTQGLGDDLLRPVKPVTDQVLGGLGR